MGEQCDNVNSTIDDGCSDSCEIINHWECPTNIQNQLSLCLPNCGDGIIISPF
jgi:cysteine-rich repeat protein